MTQDDDAWLEATWRDNGVRDAFVDLVRRGIDPDGLFRRGVWPPR
jgi:hypothetical protein